MTKMVWRRCPTVPSPTVSFAGPATSERPSRCHATKAEHDFYTLLVLLELPVFCRFSAARLCMVTGYFHSGNLAGPICAAAG